ncbi:hypothetical protein K458DRAFT_432389 [Lentithecium fluviatile CBS 122367]|uniref:Uncharacterized protein n=1 Tax=Lentithecium fluviatile CBS 122367 TaxID=1168545 RepID=A0A6G1IXK7_9PLEO|nr:hypothetical protein K458DRAFT_432389 [Lentithecium fluviatile CBS 122367]
MLPASGMPRTKSDLLNEISSLHEDLHARFPRPTPPLGDLKTNYKRWRGERIRDLPSIELKRRTGPLIRFNNDTTGLELPQVETLLSTLLMALEHIGLTLAAKAFFTSVVKSTYAIGSVLEISGTTFCATDVDYEIVTNARHPFDELDYPGDQILKLFKRGMCLSVISWSELMSTLEMDMMSHCPGGSTIDARFPAIARFAKQDRDIRNPLAHSYQAKGRPENIDLSSEAFYNKVK